jgi:hypothetical protein
LRKGTSLLTEDENYQRVLASITVDAIVDDQLGVEKFDENKVRERADSFFKFSTLANLVMPVSLMRTSKYQDVLDFWRNLYADPSITFNEKVMRFRQQYPDSAYIALTRSTTAQASANIDPSLEVFNLMKNNDKQANYIADTFGTDAVGVLASTAPSGQFNQGVYNYWLDTQAPGTDGNWKWKAAPSEIMKNSQVSLMWANYMSARTERDAELSGLGVNPSTGKPWTINSAAARDAGIADKWDSFKNRMLDHYGNIWTKYGPASYSNNIGSTLATVNYLVSDKQFMSGATGKTPVWRDIARYMNERARATAAVKAGQPEKEVKALFGDWSAGFKDDASIGFQDFWDTYLENDDLTVGVRPGG